MDTPSVPHFRFGRNAAERRRYFGQVADADNCPPQGIPRPLLMDADRILRVADVSKLFNLDVPTVVGIYWYIDGSCDELALGALETGKAQRARDAADADARVIGQQATTIATLRRQLDDGPS